MTTTASESTAVPRLERPRESAFRGVCAAVARATGTDPVLWRALLVVLVFFDGLGIVLYLVGWAAIPAEGEPQSVAQRLLHGPDRRLHRGERVLVVLLVIAGIVYVGHPRSIIVAVVVGGLGFLWWRNSQGGTPVATVAPVVPPAVPPAPAPWVAPPPRPRSPLGGVTLSAAAIVAGVLALVGVAGVDLPVAVPIAAALGVVGIGLVVGSFFGRSWGLVLLAGLLTAALGVATGVQPLLDDGVGRRDWAPTASASYRLGAGKGVLDLGSVGPTADLSARVGYGQLVVLVPEGLAVDVDADVDYGEIELFGKGYGGRHQHRTLPGAEASVHLHLSVRAGEVKVVRQ